MLTEEQKERIAEVYELEDLKGITTAFVREFYPEQVNSGKAFVVALTVSQEWANDQEGVRALIAQQLEDIDDGNTASLATSLLNNWGVGTLIFAYTNASTDGLIPDSEDSLGTYIEDLAKSYIAKNKLNMVFEGCRIHIEDSTKQPSYTRKNGEVVKIEPRQNRKGEIYYDADGNPVYRQTTLDIWGKRNGKSGKAKTQNVIKAYLGSTGNFEDTADLLTNVNVEGAVD